MEKYTKKYQLNFAKDLSILQFDLKWSLAIKQNRGKFIGIKDDSTINIYVTCEGGYIKI